MPSRRVTAAARCSSRLGRLAFAIRDASRWVRGGGGAGPRRLASASRRFGVGRPLPPTRTVSGGSCAGLASGSGERRRNLTSFSLRATTPRTCTWWGWYPRRPGSVTWAVVHVVVVVDAFGPELAADAAAEAVAAGWRAA